ncbi:MAG TPA: rRNA maturation RNase YbeY [Terriglobales bacterium]|nr:rRNA maturation RNase YbeY [Terriglobales bacterium]
MNKAHKAVVFDAAAAPELNSGSLEDFVREARRAAGLRADVSVLITGDSNMRQLNSRFRGKNSATDVLSFPAAESNGFAGDIAVSFSFASRNARALGHSVADEIRILILHGILHLAGYDHEKDRGEMEAKETALRRKLALPTGLIERSSRTGKSLVVGHSLFAKSRKSTRVGQRPTSKDQRLSRT